MVTASLAPWPLPERLANNVLAYAPTTTPATLARPTPTAPGGTRVAPALPPATTVAVKRSGDRPTVVASAPVASAHTIKAGESYNDPWLRAMILSPSAQGFMSTSLLGAADYRNLGPYLQKPTASVMMTFSDDPHLGMIPEKFNGHAVVFVSTVTFHQRTASLIR